MNPNKLLEQWTRLSRLPLGRRVFSWTVGRMARYTGSISPEVMELSPGQCRVQMRDRARVRNHLRSIHAIALTNLGEVTTGLAMLAGLPDDTRGIVMSLETEFVKKARGTITAVCDCEPPTTNETRELDLEATLRDESEEVVARVRAHWKVGPSSGA